MHTPQEWRESDSTCQEKWESGETEQAKGGWGSARRVRLHVITIWYHLGVACYGQRNRMGKKIERLDTEINERGIRRESKKEAKAGNKANMESIREGRRKSERESFSFRQRTPSDSNMKVTALATLQLLLLPAVSVCFSSAFPKASLGGVSGLGAPPGSQCPHSKMASQADWWAQALPGWGWPSHGSPPRLWFHNLKPVQRSFYMIPSLNIHPVNLWCLLQVDEGILTGKEDSSFMWQLEMICQVMVTNTNCPCVIFWSFRNAPWKIISEIFPFI